MLQYLLILGLLAMFDFPPNLEDGEQWLPSDIYEEIISDYDYKPKAKVNNISRNLAMEIKSFEHEDNKVVQVKYGKTKGTGVFIPQMTVPRYFPTPGIRKGTGVYLPIRITDELIANPTNQTSGKKEEVTGRVDVLLRDHPSEKELFLPSTRDGFPDTEPTGIAK